MCVSPADNEHSVPAVRAHSAIDVTPRARARAVTRPARARAPTTTTHHRRRACTPQRAPARAARDRPGRDTARAVPATPGAVASRATAFGGTGLAVPVETARASPVNRGRATWWRTSCTSRRVVVMARNSSLTCLLLLVGVLTQSAHGQGCDWVRPPLVHDHPPRIINNVRFQIESMIRACSIGLF